MPKNRSGRIAFSLLIIVILVFIGRNAYRRYLNNALLAAIRARDVAAMQSLLEHGADPNTRYLPPGRESHLVNSQPALAWVLSGLVLPDIIVRNPSGERPGGEARPVYLPDAREEEIACLLIRKGASKPMGGNYLVSACTIGDVPVARCLLDNGVDLKSPEISAAALGAALNYAISLNTTRIGNKVFSSARTPAEKAEVARRVAVSRQLVQLLREHGAQPTLRQAQDLGDRAAETQILNGNRAAWADQGYTALSVSAQKGDLDLMRQLLEHGADPNHPPTPKPNNPRMTFDAQPYDLPLHAAADEGNLEAVKLLLDHGADPNEQKQYMESALTAAARKGNMALVTLLLAHGADPNKINQYAEPALSVAAGAGNLTLVKLLLAHGAKLNSKGSPTGYFMPLFSAASRGHAEVVHYLLEHGADPNIQLGGGGSILASALQHPSAAIPDLLKHGANVNPVPDRIAPSDVGHSGFATSDQPHSPLTNAILYAPRYEKLLVQAGAKIGADKPTICIFAARQGRADLLPKLVAYGADVNGMDSNHETALSICIARAPGSVKFLLDHGANPNMVTWRQRTLLEKATMIGNAETVRLLLAHGADFTAHPDHHTALAWAQRKKHADIAALLQQAGAKE